MTKLEPRVRSGNRQSLWQCETQAMIVILGDCIVPREEYVGGTGGAVSPEIRRLKMARKNSLVSLARGDDGTLTFTVGTAGSFTVDPAKLADEIRDRAMIHGLVQKVSDAAAIPKSDLPEGADAIAAVKFEAMKSVADRIIAGEWAKRSGDGSGPVSGLIFRAFSEWVADMAAKKKVDAPSEEKLRATYDGKTRAEQLALRNVPAIAKIIDRIKSERGAVAAKSIDTGSLLGELGL